MTRVATLPKALFIPLEFHTFLCIKQDQAGITPGDFHGTEVEVNSTFREVQDAEIPKPGILTAFQIFHMLMLHPRILMMDSQCMCKETHLTGHM